MTRAAPALIALTLASPARAGDDRPMDLEMRVHGYGDIGLDFDAELDPGIDLGHSSPHHPLGFSVGDAVLAYGATLDQRLQMDLDVVLGLDQHGDWLALVDRMVIEIEVSEGLRIRGGKMYLPVGYWNPNIPYGGFLYPTQFRPAMLQFERHGAPIPIHQAGVDLEGELLLDLWTLGAHLGVGNGRSPHLTETQDIGDAAWAKAVWAQVTLETPNKLEVGVSGYYDDRIRTGHGTMNLSEDFGEQGDVPMAAHTHHDEVVLTGDVREAIAGAHLAWNGARTQVLVEGMVVVHQRMSIVDGADVREVDEAPVANLDGYAQVSREVSALLTPYARVDYVELWYEDPLYRDMGKMRLQGVATLGTRWELGLRAALKVEGQAQRDLVFPTVGLPFRERSRLGAGVYLVAGF